MTDATVGLVDALNSLPLSQRTAAALYYLDDLSVKEIAEVLGVSAGTVKSNLSQARTALKPVLSATQGVETHGRL